MFESPARTRNLRPFRRVGLSLRGQGENSDRLVVAAILVMILLFPGCLFRGRKDQESRYPTAPIRIALLPLNTAEINPELQETALAALVMMAEVVGRAPDLEAVPLWEAMPVAIESLRASRDISPDMAAYLASRLTARWATQGHILPAKDGVVIRLDFIPAQSSLFPFRFEKEDSLRSLNTRLNEAFKQFIEYLIARPIADQRDGRIDVSFMSQLARAIDTEYGWFGEADPGKAGEVVSAIPHKDLARFLFNPSLYPSIDEGREQPPK